MSESLTAPRSYEQVEGAVRDGRRLAAVRATGLLDTEIEEAFDRLTRLAVRLVKIPAAFVSLVDERRDFYKSACGFGEPLASSRQLEGPTFCHFTILSAEPLVIPDTNADPVYREIPTVRSLGVAAYVGIPILFSGQVIGAFCAIDSVPHAWTKDEVTVLTELAAVAVSEISLRAARAESDRFRHEAEMLAAESGAAQLALENQAKTLAKQASELERARVDAEAANRAKSDFLAGMSHDLRTPLNAIGGYAQLIEMGMHGPVTDGQRNAASRIVRAQRHLLTLIDDILQFAKTESGQLELRIRPMALSEMCGALVELIAPQASTARLTFSCELDKVTNEIGGALMAVADVERVLQILVNLSTNAIKFTDEGGRVTVTGRSSGSWAEILVRDTGRGIEAGYLEQIFEPFVQVSATPGTRGGVGLGLATSRMLARRMGGDIVVESAPGAGSTFTLRLPAT